MHVNAYAGPGALIDKNAKKTNAALIVDARCARRTERKQASLRDELRNRVSARATTVRRGPRIRSEGERIFRILGYLDAIGALGNPSGTHPLSL
jgi:hypothetical protein